jgi:hypothetical protein
MQLSWSQLKVIVAAKALNMQYVDLGDNYWIKAGEGLFEVECFLPIGVSNTDTTDFETNFKAGANKSVTTLTQSFTSKTLANGKKLFARNTGLQFTLSAGANALSYTATLPWAKVTGIEVIGAESLDYADLKVNDTAAGTYSGVPNYLLNQFAFSVNIAKDYYTRTSTFDADLYIGMVININYTSVSAKAIGVNLILSEVK